MSTYIHFSEEQKLRAASIDLVEFLARRGEKLVRSGNDRRLASDKSITVRGSGWYDHSAERGGNAISFVREFYGYSYPEAVSLLLAKQRGRHMEQSVPSCQLVLEIQNSFKPYQNRGKLQSRMDDIRQELIRSDAMQGVVSETQKEQLIACYKNLALSCAKALIISEVGRQKQEQTVNQNMSLSM